MRTSIVIKRQILHCNNANSVRGEFTHKECKNENEKKSSLSRTRTGELLGCPNVTIIARTCLIVEITWLVLGRLVRQEGVRFRYIC